MILSSPRIGVIGTGSLGYHHARILRDVKAARFMGFHESNAERAATVSKELGIRAYGSIAELLADPEKRKAMGEAGRLRATEQFSLDRMVGEMESLYESLAGGGR